MNKAHSADTDDPPGTTPAARGRYRSVDTVEHCTCGLSGALATAVIAVAFYPELLALTRPLHLLSSTVLVVILASTWFVIWLGFETLWEWRAGRLTTDA